MLAGAGAAVLVAFLIVVTSAAALAGVAATASVTVLSEGLPDPGKLATLDFAQPTIIYDRTGKVELARFQTVKRSVVTYRDLPPVVLDATTVAEDRTFWQNDGFDLQAMIAAAIQTVQGDGRGASTITQQLVRARLLPADVVAPGADLYTRKAKEIIQSARLTAEFPGETGKEQIITAYLNQNFYGHDAYGIKAAAQVYFGVTDLSRLTVAQAALLAGLPQSPTTLDPYRYAVKDKRGRLVVPPDSPPVVRRNWILSNINEGRWTRLTPAELQAALMEPVVLRGDLPVIWKAPQFDWQVRAQLEQILGSADAVDTGGYRVITTLDWRAQQLAEATVAAAVVAPNLSRARSTALLKRLGIPKADRAWINALRGKDLHNAALVALDYRTGDVRAYVGSAGYYRDGLASKRFDPKFDAAGVGKRQPGSAWKPVLYATAFDRKVLTPGSLLLDITTRFARGWAPADADRLERGPVLVRDALQMSLNIPAIRALQRVGNRAVADTATNLGIHFAGGRQAFLGAGLAGAIGTVEVSPLDLTSAFGALANGGVHVPPRMILEIRDASGNLVWSAGDPAGTRAVSTGAAYLVTNILAGNTSAHQNPIWAKVVALHNGSNGSRRPAAVKTGTTNDARDLSTYGYLPAPAKDGAPAWVVGVWMGNSDHSMPRTGNPATSLTGAAPLWQSFVRRLTAGDPVARFQRPKGVVRATIDAWSGGKPGPWTQATRTELFLAGTQPGAKRAVDQPGLLYTQACGTWVVNPVAAELGPRGWDADVANWLARARRGVGVAGPEGTRTAYFWGRSGWGGQLAGPCPAPSPQPTPGPSPGPQPSPSAPAPGPTTPPGPAGGSPTPRG
jgi:membrane peptidoglycan carboxypeptidase